MPNNDNWSNDWINTIPEDLREDAKTYDSIRQLWCADPECKACASHRQDFVTWIRRYKPIPSTMPNNDTQMIREALITLGLVFDGPEATKDNALAALSRLEAQIEQMREALTKIRDWLPGTVCYGSAPYDPSKIAAKALAASDPKEAH
jgi:hypothetical protein